jgi:predicted NAD-dependent protein-ADP-ribosyltransferase YbiA (DUF1768 family)
MAEQAKKKLAAAEEEEKKMETDDEMPDDTVPSLKEYIMEEKPYTEDRAKRILYFFRKRERNPDRFTYTKKGDLEFRGKTGAVEETIPLKVYVPYDTATRELREQTRLDAIGQAENEFETAMANLREAMSNYKATGAVQPVIAAQKAAEEADQVLSRVRFGTRNTQLIRNPDMDDVLFDEKGTGGRKLISGNTQDPWKKKVVRMVTLEFPYMSFYGTYMDAPDTEPVEDIDETMDVVGADQAAVRQKLKDGRTARIFCDADDGANGFLSPFWPVEFTLDTTRYFTAWQAYEVMRAKEHGKEEIRQALMKTRAPRTMRFLTKTFDKPLKDSKNAWLKIFTAIYSQHPELKEKLTNTGTDALVFADVRKGASGIGLGERDRYTLDPSKWQGDNHVGLALETLRYQLREGTAGDIAQNDDIKEKVISEEEQMKARQGAIINQARGQSQFQFKKKPRPPAAV